MTFRPRRVLTKLERRRMNSLAAHAVRREVERNALREAAMRALSPPEEPRQTGNGGDIRITGGNAWPGMVIPIFITAGRGGP